MNANFYALGEFGWLSILLFLIGEFERVERKDSPLGEPVELSISSHTKDQKRCPGLSLRWDASHLIVICLFSLRRWGPPSHIILDQGSV